MRTFWQPLVIACALLLSSLSLASERYIYVTGEGSTLARPDAITLSVEIRAEHPEAVQALDKVNHSFEELVAAAEQALITKESIHAETLTRQPVYEWKNDKRYLKGEQITREIKLSLRVLARYDDLLLAMASIPHLRIQRQQLHFDDPQAAALKATNLALEQAQRKAESMAKTMNTRLGKVLTIEELDQHFAQPVFMKMQASADTPSAPEMLVQRQSITSKVKVRFELK